MPGPNKPATEQPATDLERHADELLDEALEESFPASDPPAIPSLHDLERQRRAERATPAARDRKP
ncbi:hypothetical protein [Chelatococcus reniformis]|uniref:Uncharacterized protein n=1 Tax=Chelatococcus reniformis TaxID=1494448 RepID=A0A916UP87_9HYPH|nr:hypothetical protein [Chelatococcus reniformis]GGC79923.1 hypothetical protein GCM10010994_42430 [Chelatococcus reniformis]